MAIYLNNWINLSLINLYLKTNIISGDSKSRNIYIRKIRAHRRDLELFIEDRYSFQFVAYFFEISYYDVPGNLVIIIKETALNTLNKNLSMSSWS